MFSVPVAGNLKVWRSCYWPTREIAVLEVSRGFLLAFGEVRGGFGGFSVVVVVVVVCAFGDARGHLRWPYGGMT